MYLLLDLLLYWLPAAVLLAWRRRFLGWTGRRAALIVSAVMAVVTFGMEYVYLAADIWSFSGERHPLLGWSLGPAPVEEFVFWFGATPFVLGLYAAFQREPRHGR